MWNYENGLFDYLICEVCVSLSFSLIHLTLSFFWPSPTLSQLLFCMSVGVGALDLEGDTRTSALGRLSHTASLKRGGSLRTPRPSSECCNHITLTRCLRGASLSERHSDCAFVCLCVTFNDIYSVSGNESI